MIPELAGASVPIAATSRSGFDESVHHGIAVVLGAQGEITYAVGDPSVAVYPRSSMKPVQAHAMVGAGLQLPSDLLALVCASHDGSPRHLERVRRILDTVGLDETALRTTPGLPYDSDAADAVLRSGGGPTPITMNCSGKHAGMLATCVAAGWPIDHHLDVDHPLQQHVVAVVAEVIGPVVHVGIDGCGAPAHVVTLVDLARGVGRIAADRGPVYAAMTGHPDLVGGPSRPVTRIMQGVDGLLAKDGADGVFVAALPDGRAIAVKVADGAQRAVPSVVLSLLARAGVSGAAIDRVATEVEQQVRGRGRPVGNVRSLIGDTGT